MAHRRTSGLLEDRRADGMAYARASAEPLGTRTEGGHRPKCVTKLGSYKGAADYQSAGDWTARCCAWVLLFEAPREEQNYREHKAADNQKRGAQSHAPCVALATPCRQPGDDSTSVWANPGHRLVTTWRDEADATGHSPPGRVMIRRAVSVQ